MRLAVAFSYLLIHVSQCGRVRRQSVVGEMCTTPFNHAGDCRDIEDCQALLDLRKQTDGERSADVSAVLRDSRCGFTRVDPPLYCCPDLPANNTTPLPPQPTRSPSKCGKGGPISNGDSIEERIIGGGPAERGEWPWMAVLGRRRSRKSDVEWVCGGALVTERHVISAAHCIFRPISLVRLGNVNVEEGVDMEVESSVRHPEYEDGRYVNDIAVIKMKGQVSINGLIQPICLPNAATGLGSLVGQEPYIAGWGRLGYGGQPASVLHHVKVPVASENRCREAYRNVSEAVIDEKVICAGNSKKDACKGDSGGPLMHVKDNSYYIIGVVSYGEVCGESDSPTVYTKVSYYIDWINANLN